MSTVRKFRCKPIGCYKLTNTVKDLLKRVRRDQVASLAVVIVMKDGTFWTAAAAADPEKFDAVRLLGTIRFLEEDLVRQAHGEPSPISEEAT